ncbi:MAG TPA: hypothetical protein VGP38_09050 [Rubrobacter sp.]|nr:hypothetical protein [Rubrobacter sp.]
MRRDAKRTEWADDETQISAVEQVSGTEDTDVGSASRKAASDADWLSMATGDPASYIKDAE